MWRARASTRTSPRPAPRRRWAGTSASTSTRARQHHLRRCQGRPRSTASTSPASSQRTVTDKEDQQLTFSSMGSGVYSAPARLAPGLWEVEIDGKGDGVADYHKIFRFVVKADAVTLPCCTLDGEYFQPFKLEGEDADRWISSAGPGLKRIEFLVPQANRPEAMAADRDGPPRTGGRAVGPRQPHRPPRRRDLPRRRDRAAGADRPAGLPRLHGPPLRPARDRPHQG